MNKLLLMVILNLTVMAFTAPAFAEDDGSGVDPAAGSFNFTTIEHQSPFPSENNSQSCRDMVANPDLWSNTNPKAEQGGSSSESKDGGTSGKTQ